jgi:hypothetical protein
MHEMVELAVEESDKGVEEGMKRARKLAVKRCPGTKDSDIMIVS